MLYKEFGKTGMNVSSLGFGAMRLPMTETDGKAHVAYDEAVEMMQKAFELGVNYVDTAPYYCERDSEVAVGKALKGYRDKVYLSTKNPIEDASGDNWRKRLESSLSKLDVDSIDVYHMWSLSLDSFRNKVDVKDGPMEAAIKAKDEGLIKHIAFSFHDEPENMKPIIDSGYFESVLMQYNLLNRANEGNLRYAKEKGLGTVVMGPVGGGRLGAPSEVIQKMLNRNVASTAEMALRFVLANLDVDIALSGMSNISMVEENVRVASVEGTLTEAEIKVVHEMMEENKRLADLYCTGCKYCMPCPQNINIPHVFTLMNYHKVYKLSDYAKAEYAKLKIDLEKRNKFEVPNGLDISVCAECGACESKCPQHLSIIKQLKETRNELES